MRIYIIYDIFNLNLAYTSKVVNQVINTKMTMNSIPIQSKLRSQKKPVFFLQDKASYKYELLCLITLLKYYDDSGGLPALLQ